jgi:DNA mismatch endonuclease, patch repair protein
MDNLTTEQRRKSMRAVRSANTSLERAARLALALQGFRAARKPWALPGTPDLVFPTARTVVFVHGCFWHGHSCKRGRLPETRTDFWLRKISGNRRRDARVVRALRSGGWHCFTIWQCSLGADAARVAAHLRRDRNLRLKK